MKKALGNPTAPDGSEGSLLINLEVLHDETRMEYLGIDPPKPSKRKTKKKYKNQENNNSEMDQFHSGGAHINRMLNSYTLETFPTAIPVPPASVSSCGKNSFSWLIFCSPLCL